LQQLSNNQQQLPNDQQQLPNDQRLIDSIAILIIINEYSAIKLKSQRCSAKPITIER